MHFYWLSSCGTVHDLLHVQIRRPLIEHNVSQFVSRKSCVVVIHEIDHVFIHVIILIMAILFGPNTNYNCLAKKKKVTVKGKRQKRLYALKSRKSGKIHTRR